MANLITTIRIISSILLMFFPAFSPSFYILYFVCGFTDMVDGTVARRTNTVSEFGSKLDTVADFIFVAVCFIKLLPFLKLPIWIYIWILLIFILKMSNVIFGFLRQKKLIAEHTIMNKVTGFLLFLVPFSMKAIELTYSASVICIIATYAAIQEGHVIRTKK